MTLEYFRRLRAETPTRVWVNNPTPHEAELALAQGAAGCTTNPSYAGGLLRRAPELVEPLVGDVARGDWTESEGAERVQLALVGRIVEQFRPLWDVSGGTEGFVSCQGSPEGDDDAVQILAEAHRARDLGPNATPKIPATAAGLEAFEVLVAEGSPTIVTEVFSLAQLVEANERYLRVTAETGAEPPFFMSPITGIFGDHLRASAIRDGIDVDPDVLGIAGVALARACRLLCRERSYPVTLLAGGARRPFDLTGIAGEPLHATINWTTFAQILAAHPDPTGSFSEPLDAGAVWALESAFPEFRVALAPDGLTVDEFESFAPVRYFRSIFVEGWRAIEDAIADVRSRRKAAVRETTARP